MPDLKTRATALATFPLVCCILASCQSPDPSVSTLPPSDPLRETDAVNTATLVRKAFAKEFGIDTRLDPERALALWISAANGGSAFAAYFLAYKYDVGLGVPADPVRGAAWLAKGTQVHDQTIPLPNEWYQETPEQILPDFGWINSQIAEKAMQDDPVAQFNMGLNLLAGRTGILEPNTGVYWLRQAADQEFAPAAIALHRLTVEMGVLERDAQQEVAWLRTAAADDHPEAIRYLGFYHLHGQNGIARDQNKGRQLLMDAAAKGDPHAAYILGESYRDGVVLERDMTAALQWMERAHDLGHHSAVDWLAYWLETGVGGPKNPVKARDILEAGAVGGRHRSMRELARMMVHGVGGSRDPLSAEAWLNRAAMEDDVEAMILLADWNGNGWLRRDPEQAFIWRKKAAETGHAESQYQVGQMLVHGIGASSNFQEAAAWLSRAAENGHSPAYWDLAALFLRPGNTPEDLDAAWEHKLNGAEAGVDGLLVMVAPFWCESPRDRVRVEASRVRLDELARSGNGEAMELLLLLELFTEPFDPAAFAGRADAIMKLDYSFPSANVARALVPAATRNDVYPEVVTVLKPALRNASSRNPEAQFLHAMIQLKEATAPADIEVAADNLAVAAEIGSIHAIRPALWFLGGAFNFGEDRERGITLIRKLGEHPDYNEAKRLLIQAGGDPGAALSLAITPPVSRSWQKPRPETDSEDRPPAPRLETPPWYTTLLMDLNIEGEASIKVTVGPDGEPLSMDIEFADHPLIAGPAIVAIRGWKFWPGIRNGVPVSDIVGIPFGYGNAPSWE